MQDVGGNIRYYGLNATTTPVYAWQTIGSSIGEQFLGRSFTSEKDCINSMEQLANCATNYSNLGFSSQSECESGLSSLISNMTEGAATTVEKVEELYCSKKVAEGSGGADNYIYFNCSDYTNQSSSTCEVWRIIGVFDGKVKLVRDTSIGDYSWDNKTLSTGADSDYGENDWTNARLMKLLNPGYDSETVGGSLYYNAESGTCYSGQNNDTKACDFTNIGIKNDVTRNLISETVYYLGGWNDNAVYSDFIYEKERGTTVYSRRPTTWTGKIGLMYPSDYGYAADFAKCKDASGNDLNIGSYNSCRKNNYLYKGMVEWLLTPYPNVMNSVWYVNSPGYVHCSTLAFNSGGVRPVVYLNANVNIKSGTGSNSEPYQLAV